MFKIPKEEDIETALRQYDILRQTAVKVRNFPLEGKKTKSLTERIAQNEKPYILSNEAGRVINGSEARSKGWTVVAQTVFASLEDVKYYDEQCAAHKKLKSVVTPLREDASVLLFESDIPPHSA